MLARFNRFVHVFGVGVLAVDHTGCPTFRPAGEKHFTTPGLTPLRTI